MEKSLSSIEKSLGETKKSSSGKTANLLTGLAQSLNALTAAAQGKDFDAKKTSNIVDFSRNLVNVANDIKPSSAVAFAEFSSKMAVAFDILSNVMSPTRLSNFSKGAKILFDGKDSIVSRLSETLSKASVTFKGTSNKAFADFATNLSIAIESLSSIMSPNILSRISKGTKILFDGKNSLVIQISKGLSDAANEFKTNKKGFVEFIVGFAKSIEALIEIMSPFNLSRLSNGSKELFDGKDSLIVRIVRGLSNAANEFKGNKKGLAEFAIGVTTAIESLATIMSPTILFKLSKGSKVLFDGKDSLMVRIVRGLSDAADEFKSKRKGIGELISGVATGLDALAEILSPMKLIRLSRGSKVLFEGKNSLIKRIVSGISDAFNDMNPSKVKQGTKAIKDIGEGLLSLSKALKSLIVIGLAAPLVAMGALVVKGVVKMFMFLADAEKGFGQGAKALKPLGEGLLALSKAMKSLILIGIAAPLVAIGALVVRAVVGLFASIGKRAKDIEQGGHALRALGKGLLVFSAGLATIVLVTLIAGPKIIEAMAMVALVGLTFWALGKASQSIRRGARAVALMGLAMFGFAAALATLALVLMIVKPMVIVAAIAIIAGFALVFALIGNSKVSREIAEGALILILGISLGLFIFSGALLVLAYAMKLWTLENAVLATGLIIGLGFAIGFVGRQKGIERGAAALFEMGIGLLGFSVGLLAFGGAIKLLQLIFKDNLGEAGLIAGSILIGLGLAFAFIGKMASSIFEGSVAMFAVGAALISVSVGILIFGLAVKALQAIFGDDLAQAGVIAGGILIGLGLAFAAIGFAAPLIIPGAAAMFSVGVSLMAVSAGILIFGLAIKALQAIFGDGLAEAGKIAGGILLGLGLAFSAIGLLSPAIILGSVSVLLMGASLLVFSVGLLAFAGATKVITNVFGAELDKVGDKIKSFLLDVGLAFSGIGLLVVPIALGAASVILMGASLLVFGGGLLVFGFAMGQLDSKGLLEKDGDDYTIKGLSVMSSLAKKFSSLGWTALNPLFWGGVGVAISLGGSLLIISAGLYAAATAMEKIKDMDKLVDGIFGDDGLIPTMAESFAKIGDKYGGGLLSSFLGTDKVSMGVRVTRGFGDVLQEIAGGIAAFANFSEFPVKVPDPKDPSKLIYRAVDMFGEIIPKISENVPSLLSTLADVFASIGEKYGGDGGWFGEDSPVQKGIAAVKGIGGVLSEVAGGIQAFANFEEFPIQAPDPKDPSKLIYKAVNLFDTLPKIKEVLIGDGTIQGKLTGKTGILMSLAEIFAEIGDKYGDKEGGWFGIGSSKSPVKKGIDAVRGIGGVISELANGIIAFANMKRGLPNYDKDGKFNGTYTPFSIEDVKNNILEVLHTLPDIFAQVNVEEFKKAKETADAAVPVAEAVSRIGKALQDLQKEKTKNEKTSLTEITGDLTSAVTKIAELQNLNLDKEKSKLLEKLGDAIGNIGSNMARLISDNKDIKANQGVITVIKEFLNYITALKLDDGEARANNLKSLGGGIVTMGTSISQMVASNKDLNKDIVTSIKSFLDYITTLKIADTQISKINSLSDALAKLSTTADPLTRFAMSLTLAGRAFGAFSAGFGTFASRLDKFYTFEKAFSNLVKNQYTFKFDQFSRSMGTLKNNVNEFNVENLKLTDSLMKSLAILSKSPDAVGQSIKEEIADVLKQLVEAVQKMEQTNTTTNTNLFGGPGGTGNSLMSSITSLLTPAGGKNTPAGNQGPAAAPIDPRIATALQQLAGSIDGLSRKFIVGKNSGIKVDTT